jgi:hypothetical protein
MKKNETAALGFLDHGTVRGEFAHDLFLLGASRPGRFTAVCNVQDNLISRGRNMVVEQFLQSQADWLFFVDADQRFKPETFDALEEVADSVERPIVTGLYFSIGGRENFLYPVPMPTIFTRHPERKFIYDPILHYPPNATIEIDACGAGMMLIHRGVFETLRESAEPGFEHVFFHDQPVPGGDWIGEDIVFCRMVKDAGYKIFCHTGAVSPHIKHYLVTDEHFQNSLPYLDTLG